MAGQLRRRLSLLALAVLVPLALYTAMRTVPGLDFPWFSGTAHFFSVLPVSFLAAVSAIAVGISGNRLRNIQVTFLALAFSSLALIFMLHGLTTPGMIMPPQNVIGVAAQLSFVLTSCWIGLSVVPADQPVVRALARMQGWLVPLWTAVLLTVMGCGLFLPHVIEGLLLTAYPIRYFVAIFTLSVLIYAGWRYWHSYRYSRLPLQIAMVYSCGWIAVGEMVLVTSRLFYASWWIYHFLLLFATVAMLVGLVRQYASGSSVALAVKGLFTQDPLERIAAGISPAVRALVVATEAKDLYTAGHALRVAMFALHIGEAMNLPPEQLRAIAQGGVIHDVGKLEVPDAILNKPGALTPEERLQIERHPATGYEMCKRLGFVQDELDVIRHHHERWDGKGYPDHLAGRAIPPLARVLAVADVYDALTSDRSYRKGKSHEEARGYILAGAGSQFDPGVVQAFARLSESGPLAEPAVAAARQM